MRYWLIAIGFLSAGACAGEGDAPRGDPRAGRAGDLRGYAYAPDALAGVDETFYWAQQAIADYRPLAEKDRPARVVALPPPGCRFPTPADGDIVRHVQIAQGGLDAPIYQFSASDIGSRAERFVETYQNTKGRLKSVGSYADGDVMRLVNVVVTETSAPVYLVLTSETNVLWNIATAPGARLSSIALISADGVALSNAPDDVNVNALYGDAVRLCKVFPARRPKDDWTFVQNAKASGSATYKSALAENHARASAYSKWFKTAFGVSAEREVITHRGIGNALIGPLPTTLEARAPMRPLAGATVAISSADHLIIGGKRGYQPELARLVEEAARTAAGGDLRRLIGS